MILEKDMDSVVKCLNKKKENRRPRRIEPQVFTIRALVLLPEKKRGTTLSSFHLKIDLK